jgi:hypothetical protein
VVNATSKPPRAGATPKKLALIGVLAVVLVGVLYFQFGGSAEEDVPLVTAAEATTKRPPRPATSAAAGAAKATSSVPEAKEWLLEPIDRPQWKAPELAHVVRYDPFALPAAFPQPGGVGATGVTTPDGVVVAAGTETDEDLRSQTIAEIHTKLNELKQRGVRVIIDGRKNAAAIVGDRTIHVGDEIEGFTVKAIDSDGVVVERKLD